MSMPPCESPVPPEKTPSRFAAQPLTTLFLLATFAVSVLWFRPDLRLMAFSFTSVGFLVAQVGLGALTITSSLDWVIVTMHLALGTATFASSLLVAFLALRPSSPDPLYLPTAE